jgi:cellulose synthase operon protein C
VAGPTWPSSSGSRFFSPILKILTPSLASPKTTSSSDPTRSNQTLDRLRAINPNDPDIARIQSMSSSSQETEQLSQAGELTRQGRNDDAMRIYRQLYGDQPPNGDIALAYYQTLYGTASGKQQAIAGMRALADRNPGDPRYAISWASCSLTTAHAR